MSFTRTVRYLSQPEKILGAFFTVLLVSLALISCGSSEDAGPGLGNGEIPSAEMLPPGDQSTESTPFSLEFRAESTQEYLEVWGQERENLADLVVETNTPWLHARFENQFASEKGGIILLVEVWREGLEPGDYQGEIVIFSPQDGEPLIIPVLLQVDYPRM